MASDYLDISVPLGPDMLTWSGHESVSFDPSKGIHAGHRYQVTTLRLSSHSGTHVDSPLHFAVGDQTVDQLPLEVLIGPAHVYDFRGTTERTADALSQASVGAIPRVLLKTDNSAWIRTGPMPDLPAHLTEEAARFLIDRGVLLVGIDGLSPDHPSRADVHLALLRAGVIIVEAVDLSEVAPGDYDLICLPLRIAGADGAPARAVLKPR